MAARTRTTNRTSRSWIPDCQIGFRQRTLGVLGSKHQARSCVNATGGHGCTCGEGVVVRSSHGMLRHASCSPLRQQPARAADIAPAGGAVRRANQPSSSRGKRCTRLGPGHALGAVVLSVVLGIDGHLFGARSAETSRTRRSPRRQCGGLCERRSFRRDRGRRAAPMSISCIAWRGCYPAARATTSRSADFRLTRPR